MFTLLRHVLAVLRDQLLLYLRLRGVHLQFVHRVQVFADGLIHNLSGHIFLSLVRIAIGIVCFVVDYLVSRFRLVVRACLETRSDVVRARQMVLIILLMSKHINVLQGEVELLDDGHFLVIEMDLMLAHDVQQSRGCQAAEQLLIPLMLHNFQHPEYRVRANYLLLAG